MNSTKDKDSGQVTILVLAITLSILSLVPIVGSIAEVAIAQHRLNNLADFAALAGGQELEFAPESACDVARNFVQSQSKANAYCEVENAQIYVRLKQPVSNVAVRRLIPELTGISRAGISTDVTN